MTDVLTSDEAGKPREYADLSSQSASLLRARLTKEFEIAEGIKYRSYSVGSAHIAESGDGKGVSFSISRDNFQERIVYNFEPDGAVIKTGAVYSGDRKVAYTKRTGVDSVDEETGMMEVGRPPLKVGIDELRTVAQIIRDPQASAGLIDALPKLSLFFN